VDRAAWLAERRQAVIADYDHFAPTYETVDYPRDVQAERVKRLAASCPAGGAVLDAGCGTGRYFPVLAAAGLRITGVDQSAGMLAQARARRLAEELGHVDLEDLSFDAAFDAVLCVDALENVPPEAWPAVARNLGAAVRSGGQVYVTVEEIADADIDRAHTSLIARGLPAVRGEVVEGDVAGYHHYPGRAQALRWLEDAGLDLIDEQLSEHEGWAYRHLLLRRR
jgi:2-polyprenyl-3-methyl-5-hydroxy-6-metoxy-1,4-benzoquinol methylase